MATTAPPGYTQTQSVIGCPGCQAQIGVPLGTAAGAQLQCPTCKAVVGVPAAAAPAPVAAATQQLIQCPSCKQNVGVPPGCAPGSQLSCPSCKAMMAIPGAAHASHAATNVVVVTNTRNGSNREESDAQMFFLIGFFCSCLWLYCAYKFLKHANPRVSRWGKFSLFAFLFFCALEIGLTIFYVDHFASIAKTYSYGYGYSSGYGYYNSYYKTYTYG